MMAGVGMVAEEVVRNSQMQIHFGEAPLTCADGLGWIWGPGLLILLLPPPKFKDYRCLSLHPAQTLVFVWCFLYRILFDPHTNQGSGSSFNPRVMTDSPGFWRGEVITLDCY